METLTELYEYFAALVRDYFTLDVSSLENISLDSSGVSIPLMLIGLFLGVIIAGAMAIYNKRFLGDAVRHIIAMGATSPENAKTLAELEFGRAPLVRRALRYGALARKYVHCVEDDEKIAAFVPTKREKYLLKVKTDFSNAHFYIPEEKVASAELRFDKKGTSWLSFFALVIVSTVIFALIMKFLPEILSAVDSAVGSIKSDPKILQ